MSVRNATKSPRQTSSGTYDVLVGRSDVRSAARETDLPCLSILPSSADLAAVEIEFVDLDDRATRLKAAIAQIDDDYDFVIIDCPPSLGLLTLNALVAADELLLPIQTEYYALEGVGQLVETVELVRTNLNPALHVSTVLLTMVDARTRLSAGVADEVRSYFGDAVLRTAIPRSVRVSEAPSYGQSVLTYDPTSPGALCYREAARELAHRADRGAPA